MSIHFRKFVCLLACVGLLLGAETAAAQDLGHKLPGLIGLDAGKVPEPGLYLLDRFVFYNADQLRDRNGNVIPVGPINMQALSNSVGISYTTKVGKDSLRLTLVAAVPATRFTLNTESRPEANFDRFGLSDIYLQPARLGWRGSRFDVVTSYGLYLPTGTFLLGGGKSVSSGQVTHQFSAGGSIYVDQQRKFFLTALGSYDLNLRKRNLDLTRGDTFSLQGGAGVSSYRGAFEAGVASYALWQVRDDRGSALPPLLRGARDRVYGVGPEVAVFVKGIRSQIRARYEWDFGVQSRPQGQIFTIGLIFAIKQSPVGRPPNP